MNTELNCALPVISVEHQDGGGYAVIAQIGNRTWQRTGFFTPEEAVLASDALTIVLGNTYRHGHSIVAALDTWIAPLDRTERLPS